ncbi:MAG: hypothetical protein IKG52_03175, partial [Rhodobacteraceae bacterium]|nr:hypothetical protein [Paracoccaceae bacterium]
NLSLNLNPQTTNQSLNQPPKASNRVPAAGEALSRQSNKYTQQQNQRKLDNSYNILNYMCK